MWFRVCVLLSALPFGWDEAYTEDGNRYFIK